VQSIAVLLFLSLSAVAQVSFGPAQVINTNAMGAQSVYATDLDGDGDADALSASPNDDKIAWYENMGGGTFGPQQVITTNANGATSVYATDLDGDGDADVLSASSSDDKIAWYENMGGGNFGTQQVLTGPQNSPTSTNGALSVYATDLDGDGDADVLSASTYDHKIAWYENRINDPAHADFGTQQVITTNAFGARCVHATDLDGDGDADVISASLSDNKIAWYENTGPASPGSFGPQQVITTNAIGANSVHAADLDGDGDADVLSASYFDNKIAWHENLGGGNFSGQQLIAPNANGATCVHATDLDGDGDADVLAAAGNDDMIAWYENMGGGTFGSQQVITSNAPDAYSVYAIDLDGDHFADVLSASSSDDKIAWHENLRILWRYAASQAPNLDVTISLYDGQAMGPYFLFHSADPLNGSSPGAGFAAGLHMSLFDLLAQFNLGVQGVPLFGGLLDSNGTFSMVLPGASLVGAAGLTIWSVGLQTNPNPAVSYYEPTPVGSITFQ